MIFWSTYIIYVICLVAMCRLLAYKSKFNFDPLTRKVCYSNRFDLHFKIQRTFKFRFSFEFIFYNKGVFDGQTLTSPIWFILIRKHICPKVNASFSICSIRFVQSRDILTKIWNFESGFLIPTKSVRFNQIVTC